MYTNFTTDLITNLPLKIGRSRPGYTIKYSMALNCSHVNILCFCF